MLHHHHQQHRMALALMREGQLKGDSCDVFQSHSNDQTDCLCERERHPEIECNGKGEAK